MWVCRSGENNCFFEEIAKNKRIYIPWLGYDYNFSQYKTVQAFREIVAKEKNSYNKTSISNWSSQLDIFCNKMRIGDYVIVPGKDKAKYVLAKIIGEYQYNRDSLLKHSRQIEVIMTDIDINIFSQDIVYSLRAYRSIFRVSHEEAILSTLNMLGESNGYTRDTK